MLDMKLHEQIVENHRDVLESGLTQDEMAAKLSVSRPTIRRALELIGVVNKSPVGDFVTLVDENYPPLKKDGSPGGKRLPQPGQSHINSLPKGAEQAGACLIAKSLNMKVDGDSFQRGRVAYAIRHGKDPGGLNVERTCGNRKCINIEHLKLSKSKNTHRKYDSMISDSRILELVCRFDMPLKEIAEQLDISQSYVSKLARVHFNKRRYSKTGQNLIYYTKAKGKPDRPSSIVRNRIHYLTDEQYERFLKYENYGLPGECWNWLSDTNAQNRAEMKLFQVPFLATRLAYAIEYDVDPWYWDVLHNCDNPQCVNPNHLILGDPQLNADHRRERNRFVASYGNTKIQPGSEEEKILLESELPLTILEKQLGVHRKTIWQRRKQHQQSKNSDRVL